MNFSESPVLTPEDFRTATAEMQLALLEACQAHYRHQLVSLVIFGSVARGTPHALSDVDLLIVARALPDGRWNRSRDFISVEAEVEKRVGHWRQRGWEWELSPLFKTPEEVEIGSPLFLDMVDDARLLFDPEGFFAARLERLRQTLQRQGSRRIWTGRTWHWDLKPDFRPGDRIEL